jgi:hypothetical protein
MNWTPLHPEKQMLFKEKKLKIEGERLNEWTKSKTE